MSGECYSEGSIVRVSVRVDVCIDSECVVRLYKEVWDSDRVCRV